MQLYYRANLIRILIITIPRIIQIIILYQIHFSIFIEGSRHTNYVMQ